MLIKMLIILGIGAVTIGLIIFVSEKVKLDGTGEKIDAKEPDSIYIDAYGEEEKRPG